MKILILKNTAALLTIAFTITILTSCQKDPIDWYRPIGSPMSSYVKYINAVPGSTMDFYNYYTEVVDSVKYSFDQPYTPSPYGNIVVYATNMNQSSNRITATTSATSPQMNAQGFVADFYQTMITCKTTDSTNAETMILLRDNLAAPQGDNAHIRFVYLTQRGTTKTKTVDFKATEGPGGPMDIYTAVKYRVPSNAVLIDPARGLNTAGLGVYTSGPFSPVTAGDYNFIVSPSGTADTVVTKMGVKLEAGKIYTIFTSGKIGDAAAAPTLNLLKHN